MDTAIDNLSKLKLMLREDDVSFFTDEELKMYLQKNNNDINFTAYECLIIKAENNTVAISGLTLEDTSKYWLRLAKMYAPVATTIIRGG